MKFKLDKADAMLTLSSADNIGSHLPVAYCLSFYFETLLVVPEAEINADHIHDIHVLIATVLNSSQYSETDKNVYSLQRYLGSPSISVEN